MANTENKKEEKVLKQFVLKAIVDSRKKEREVKFTGKVINAEEYLANTAQGSVTGIAFELDNLPYKLRLLKGSVKGGSRASHFIGCDVEFTGNTREYEGREYFNAMDCKTIRESGLAKLAKAGVGYAGSLD